jgi:hypothetical protein
VHETAPGLQETFKTSFPDVGHLTLKNVQEGTELGTKPISGLFARCSASMAAITPEAGESSRALGDQG